MLNSKPIKESADRLCLNHNSWTLITQYKYQWRIIIVSPESSCRLRWFSPLQRRKTVNHRLANFWEHDYFVKKVIVQSWQQNSLTYLYCNSLKSQAFKRMKKNISKTFIIALIVFESSCYECCAVGRPIYKVHSIMNMHSGFRSVPFNNWKFMLIITDSGFTF